MKPILFIAHSEAADGGRLAVHLRRRGYGIQVVRPIHGDALPERFDSFEGCVVLGGPMSANDDHLDGIRLELAWMERALGQDLPLLGVCLGAQLMARILGARVWVHPPEHVEIGYHEVVPTRAGEWLFPRGLRAFQWHREGFDFPRGATVLAEGTEFPSQAFSVDEVHYAFQFHPELTPRRLAAWLSNAAHRLTQPGAHSPARQWRDQALYDAQVDTWIPSLIDAKQRLQDLFNEDSVIRVRWLVVR